MPVPLIPFSTFFVKVDIGCGNSFSLGFPLVLLQLTFVQSHGYWRIAVTIMPFGCRRCIVLHPPANFRNLKDGLNDFWKI